jgi:hypothetical protein
MRLLVDLLLRVSILKNELTQGNNKQQKFKNSGNIIRQYNTGAINSKKYNGGRSKN